MFLEYAATNQRFFLAVIITVIVSICIHELAHGIVAIWLGDRTPIETGHMTLNPAVHMGVFSVICLLLAGIAWGAMPVDPTRLRGKYSDAIVAFAGPFSNMILAAMALGGLGLWQRFDERATEDLSTALQNLTYLLWVFGVTNINLALFNLIPVPPLDGSHILANFSRSYSNFLKTITMNGGGLSLMLILFAGAGKFTSPMALRAADKVLMWARGF